MGKVPTPKNSNLYLLHIEMSFKEEDVTTSLTLSLTLSFMLPCSYEKKNNEICTYKFVQNTYIWSLVYSCTTLILAR